MDVSALFRELSALPAVRRVAAPAPLAEAYQVAGIEVATTVAEDERTFRRRWRERYGRGPTPLILVRDDPDRDGCVLVLGPVDGQRAERSVRTEALAGLLRGVSSFRRLDATRRLAAELERLDEQGTPGVQLRDLLSEWTVHHRLRGDAERWSALADDVARIGGDRGWRRVLEDLGWSIERLPVRGYLLRHEGVPAAVVHPYRDPGDFARLDDEGRPPEGLLLNAAEQHGARFGMLASGTRLRLLVAEGEGGAASRYIDLDAAGLSPDDLPLLGLLAPRALLGGGFDRLRDEARRFGEQLRLNLDTRLRQDVLPVLAEGLQRWADDDGRNLNDDDVREELRRAALTLVFRVLFLLYAEASRYLPIDHTGYRPNSLSSLVEEAARDRERLDPGSTNLWDRFMLLVKAMRRGETKWDVPAYNGALFSAEGFEGASLLERVELPDPVVGALLLGVGRDPESGRGLDYSTLGIGHVGHLYEGLLSLELSRADQPLSYDRAADRYVPAPAAEAQIDAGALVWQTQEGGRKAGGVYYTRQELVRHLVDRAVRPRFREHLSTVRTLAESDPAAAAERLLDFAVLDPACGSAHFLVEVTAALADEVVRFLANQPLPAVRESLDRLLARASTVTDIEDVAVLRRLVLKRCVYGVDLSVMGAEIARLSLWLATFVPGLSLAYLERNIRRGNALIGVASIDEIRPSGAERGFYDDALDEAIEQAATAARQVAAGDDRTPDEVRASQAADARVDAAVAPLARLLDLHTADALGLQNGRVEAEV